MKKFLKLLLALLLLVVLFASYKHLTLHNIQCAIDNDTSVEFKKQLVSTTENPVPKGGHVDIVEVETDIELRVASWVALQNDSLGTILILPGYTEFIEKYFETVRDLRALGYNVVVMDWRGQGLSTKLLPDKHKGYIEDFADFGKDAEQVYQDIVRNMPKPHFLIGHSMGGHLAFRELQDHPSRFAAAALCAPMQKIRSMESSSLFNSSSFFEMLGLGQSYVVGGKKGNINKTHERLTSDSLRFHKWTTAFKKEPQLLMGSATWSWSRAGAESMLYSMEEDNVKKILTPTYIASAKADQIVDPDSHDGLDEINPYIRVVDYQNAEHEIFIEVNELRDRFLNDIQGWFTAHSKNQYFDNSGDN